MSATCAICPSCNQPIPPPHGITIDGRAVIIDDKEHLLTASEMAIFELLLSNIGRTVRYTTLYNKLYGQWLDETPDPQIVNVLVSKIRKRLVTTKLRIGTEYGIGYRLELPRHKPRIGNVENARTAAE